ncbi:YbbR-like domain-containing protein [Priestia endophytica]|uniref:CdaR family protein n=1 Tax=Priestia endophytica TaxID=135735 RepID=UPI00227F1D8D|nr:CdaR family protein [Priestia endophytica]MCY8234739.1 CdaR family protein [Priestia endophytica]
MDKLMNNHWFMKIIALLLAFMLYLSVTLEETGSSSSPFNSSSSNGSTSNEETQTIQDVPVTAYFDDEKYIVSGLPETVDITLKGSKSDIKLQRDVKVYANLENLKPGNHQVKLHDNIDDGLSVEIDPKTVQVTIEQKVSKKFPLEVSLASDQIKSGYVAGTPSVSPKSVVVTGGKSQIESISSVKALVEEDDADSTIKQQAKVVAFDRNLNKLNVDINPEFVQVNIPIKRESKSVPLKFEASGTPSEGVKVTSIEPQTKEAVIYGDEDALKSVNEISEIPVDVSDVRGTKTVEVNVPLPEGIKRVSPESVKVKVNTSEGSTKEEEVKEDEKETVEKETTEPEETTTEEEEKEQEKEDEEETNSTRTISGVSLSIGGQSDSFLYQMLTPSNGTISISATGPKNTVQSLSAGDISASVSASGYEAGTYTLPISVSGPSGVQISPNTSTAKVEITAKEQEEEPPPEEEEEEQQGEQTTNYEQQQEQNPANSE